MTASSGFFSPRWDRLNMHPLLNSEFAQLYYAHCCKRVQAIKSLLGRLPSAALSRLEELNRGRAAYWFMPYDMQYGMVEECPDGRMIYLSQALELLSDDAVMGAVAHELAHLIQGHLDVPAEKRGEDTTEKDADETVRAWGLGKELKAYREQSVEADRVIWNEARKKLESIFKDGDGTSATNEQGDDPSELTPEDIQADEKMLAEMEAEIQGLQQLGWHWSEDDQIHRQLVHPEDPEVSIWYDPYTGEKLLSPKLAERLREIVQRERAAGGPEVAAPTSLRRL